jgi:trehalose synthase
MGLLHEVGVTARSPEAFADVLSDERYKEFEHVVAEAQQLLKGRTVWNVNSTAHGGGVAEMLPSLMGFALAAGISTRWMVITGDSPFFEVTKRIHNNLHGMPGDGGELGEEERAAYEKTLEGNGRELTELVELGDVVILHDPQTAGMLKPLHDKGVHVVWRCHVGLDAPNDVARRAWNFLLPYIREADAYIFSRRGFAWEGIDTERLRMIAPSIDAFAPKNQELDEATVSGILAASGLMEGSPGSAGFTRFDGSSATVTTQASLFGAPPLPPDAKVVVQVSRWDGLKDPLGVMKGFVDHVLPRVEAYLVLAGPAVDAVSDDPEGKMVLDSCVEAWRALSPEARDRVRLAALSMEDGEENAAIVNALQRRADVVVQKSLAEGFGLTVAEAMWKARPVVASRIGGIQDQIEHGVSGLLVDDPTDLEAYGDAVASLLEDPRRAAEIGEAAKERVRENFLGARHLAQYLDLIKAL